MKLRGFAIPKKDAQGISTNDMSEFRKEWCIAMEINEGTKCCLLLNPKGTALGQFDLDQILTYFRCSDRGGILLPPDLNAMDEMLYMTKVMSYKENQQRNMKMIRKMIIGHSLQKGTFQDYLYFNFAKPHSR